MYIVISKEYNLERTNDEKTIKECRHSWKFEDKDIQDVWDTLLKFLPFEHYDYQKGTRKSIDFCCLIYEIFLLRNEMIN